MAKIKARVVPEGNIGGLYNPLTLILLDADDVKAAGLDYEKAMHVAATYTDGPCGIDIYDRKYDNYHLRRPAVRVRHGGHRRLPTRAWSTPSTAGCPCTRSRTARRSSRKSPT